MLEGLALLVAIYGLTMLLPALSMLRKMREINKNGRSVPGTVINVSNTRNMLAGPAGGTAHRTRIQYRPPSAEEPYEIYQRDHNLLMSKDYSQGETVEVIYDASAPYKAYPKLEWTNTLKDFRSAGICFIVSILFLVLRQMIK